MNKVCSGYYTPLNMLNTGKNKAILGLMPPVIVPKTYVFCPSKCPSFRYISFYYVHPCVHPNVHPSAKMPCF